VSYVPFYRRPREQEREPMAVDPTETICDLFPMPPLWAAILRMDGSRDLARAAQTAIRRGGQATRNKATTKHCPPHY
jgi:hypothetical protein